MQKEIFEQPVVVAQTLQSYLRPLEQKIALPDMEFSFGDVPSIAIVGRTCRGVALVATSKSFGLRPSRRSRTQPPTRYVL